MKIDFKNAFPTIPQEDWLRIHVYALCLRPSQVVDY